jgi:hypothetical protein
MNDISHSQTTPGTILLDLPARTLSKRHTIAMLDMTL